MLNPRQLNASLVLAQVVGVLTLLRSVAFDRWITVLASVLLIVGATAARRNRSWGVVLALGAAAAFPTAWLIGIAFPWFALVGVVGAMPFVLASRSFARFDKGATALLASVATAFGVAGAMIWKEIAWPVFLEYPLLRPSLYPHHAAWLLPLLALSMVALRVRPSRGGRALVESEDDEEVRVRVGTEQRVRIDADASERLAMHELDGELDGAPEAYAPKQAKRGSA